MTRTLLSRLINVPRIIGKLHKKSLHTDEVKVTELQIPVNWGHISAKLWGDENKQPILAVHGWQDNAGTWDTLAPMLAKHRPILAIDYPGHGLSSWYPAGMQYFPWDLPREMLRIKNYFKWDKIALLSHSMGSIASFRFSCVFSDEVEFYISLDNMIYDDYDINFVLDKYPALLRKFEILHSRLYDEPPSYPLEEMAKIWHLGTGKSVSIESAYHLMKRGAKPSKKDPNKYYFSRDSRLKYTLFHPEDKKFVEHLAKKLQCPTLYIKAIDSHYATDAYATEMREFLERNNPNFESHFVPGTHHLHLNNPERLYPIILQFYKKYNVGC